MQSSAEHAGYIVGIIIGLGFMLGIMAFAIFAIVKAFTKRTTGWIIAGSISGALGLFVFVCFAIGFVRGVTRGLKANREQREGSTVTAGSQIITGIKVNYTVTIPSDWTIQRQRKDFDLLANHGTLYAGVIAEEADLGSPETVANIARKNLSKVAENVQLTDPAPFEVDGRSWLRYTVTCDVQKLPFYYQCYVYAGKEGTFQIVAWTFQNLKDKDGPQMDTLAQSFAFPK
jgi:hypothetical protein